MDTSNPGSLRVFRLRGIPVYFHFTFLFLLLILFSAGLLGGGSAWHDALLLAGVFGSVFLHELGHAFTALYFGIGIVSITMYPIGGVARLSGQPQPWPDIWITAAGPAVNLVLAILAYAALAILPGSSGATTVLQDLAMTNIGLLLFNMIPAFPMDGGRLLRAMLALRKSSRDATRIATNVARVIAVLMGAYGIWAGRYMLLIIAWFVYSTARRERTYVETAGVLVNAAVDPGYVRLEHSATLGAAAAALEAAGQTSAVVFHGENVVGIVDEARLQAVLKELGPQAFLAGSMTRDWTTLRPDDDLAEAWQRTAATTGIGLVMEGSRIYGILNEHALRRFFARSSA